MSNETNDGLKMKYHVTKADGTPIPEGVFMFILKPSTDLAAWIALKAYADATPNKQLSKDLYAVLEQNPKTPEPHNGFHWRSQAEIDIVLIEKRIVAVLCPMALSRCHMSRRDIDSAILEADPDLKMELFGSVILMMMNDGRLGLDDDSNLYLLPAKPRIL